MNTVTCTLEKPITTRKEDMSNILVTGAAGFVGNRLLAMLKDNGHCCRAAVRRPSSTADVDVESIVVGEIDAHTEWQKALQGIEVVVHLAARVHIMHDEADDPLAEFRKINLEGTRKLAEDAVRAGVKRLVYISSIKVNGEATHGAPFTTNDTPVPTDPYAITKWEAEQMLRDISSKTGLEIVIIRPPLVYGPGVKANFLNLIKLVRRRIPLPLGGIDNKRTLVALDNLADLIMRCCEHPAAAGHVFLAGDDESLSTPELVNRIARSMGRRSPVFYFPPMLLAWAARLLGKQAVWQRLAGSLEVDNSLAKQVMDWQPVISLDEELKHIADNMRAQHN